MKRFIANQKIGAIERPALTGHEKGKLKGTLIADSKIALHIVIQIKIIP